jgi:ribonuclease HI
MKTKNQSYQFQENHQYRKHQQHDQSRNQNQSFTQPHQYQHLNQPNPMIRNGTAMVNIQIVVGTWIWSGFGAGSFAVSINNGTYCSPPICGAATETTWHKLSLIGVCTAIESIQVPCAIEVITDNEYLENVINEWMPVWEKNGWTTKQGKTIANLSEIQRLAQAISRHDVSATFAHQNDPSRAICAELTAVARNHSYETVVNDPAWKAYIQSRKSSQPAPPADGSW